MRNILVIDDEESIVLMITMALARHDFNVEIAKDGIEGIQKFDTGNFDLVITDIIMPGIDGNGLVRHIRQSGKNLTPVLGMSGTPWLLKESAFDVVLPKPFSIKTLIDTAKILTNPPLTAAAAVAG